MNEEEKAIKRLEEMKNNYSLNGEDLHYANILYYLIINLQQENQKLKEQLEKKYKEVGTLTNEILYEENTKLLSVLDEIREYFNPDKWDEKILIIDTVYNEINRILDMEKIND